MTIRLAKHRWYLAKYQQVNGVWETHVLVNKSWGHLWKAREEERGRKDGFAPFRGEHLMARPNLVFVSGQSEFRYPPGRRAT